MRQVLTLLAATVLVAGCMETSRTAPVVVAAAPAPAAARPTIPWQVAPATPLTAQVHRDEPRVTEIEGWGKVLATRRVLASFPNELRSRRGRNRTVEPCRAQMEALASTYGQARVDAASQGPERQVGRGVYRGTVEMRIVYRRGDVHEVRQATMQCSTRGDGTLVEATPVFPIDDETTG